MSTEKVQADFNHRRRNRLLSIALTLLLLVGVVLGVTRPAWLTEPLLAAVQNAGAAAPLVFVLLTALATPLHLNGVLVVLSTVIWPLPIAAVVSYSGTLLGSVLTAALLSRLGGAALQQQDGWPAWLTRLASMVSQRPLAAGLLARIGLGSGIALEAFYVLTGFSWKQYLFVTVIGLAVWIAQNLLGVTVLHWLLQRSAGLAVAAALVPVLMLAAAMALRARRRRSG